MESGFIIEDGKLIKPVGTEQSHIVIPDNVEIIGEYAFANFHDIESIVLHEGVKEIERGAFQNCHDLRRLIIPNGNTKLGKEFFTGCKNLKITFGSYTTVMCPDPFIDRVEERIAYDLEYLFRLGPGIFGEGNHERVSKFRSDVEESAHESAEICEASIVTVDNLRPCKGADRLQCTKINGRNVIVDDTCRIGQRMVCFPLGVQLDQKFASENHLVRRMDWSGIHIEGYLHPEKRVVVPIRIRGERSDGLALPIEVLSKYTDIERLRDGDRFYTLNDHKICRVFIPDSMRVGYFFMELERYYESRMSPKTVIVPWGIKMIGRNAFSFCRKVEKIVLPGSLIDIYEEAFSFCENLKEIIIPKGVKHIKSRAFYGCRSLTHIELPDSVQEIGGGIFDNCPGIQKVKLPNNVEIKEWLINDPIFDMSSFNQESPDHTIVNGVVFSKDGTELISYLKNKQDAKYTVPAGVRVIRKNAFKGNQYLTEVIIPEGVTRIGGRAFEGCMNLRSATIPASVTEMGVNVFIGIKPSPTVIVNFSSKN